MEAVSGRRPRSRCGSPRLAAATCLQHWFQERLGALRRLLAAQGQDVGAPKAAKDLLGARQSGFTYGQLHHRAAGVVDELVSRVDEGASAAVPTLLPPVKVSIGASAATSSSMLYSFSPPLATSGAAVTTSSASQSNGSPAVAYARCNGPYHRLPAVGEEVDGRFQGSHWS